MPIFSKIFSYITNTIMRKSVLIFILIMVLLLTLVGGTLHSVFESMGEQKEEFTIEYLWNWEENENDLFDGYWWAIVTMTTVGYGDKYPVTIGGRIVAIPLMIIGIGIIGLLIGVISEGILSLRSRLMKGYGTISFKNHIIVCGWNASKVDTIINEIRGGSALSDIPIVLVNDKIDENPYIDKKNEVHYIKGLQSDSETLKRANIDGCSKAIILAENDDPKSDDTTILTVLQIESLNKDIFTCAELIDMNKSDLLRKANCDEIVAASDFSVKLLVQSIEDPGLSIIIGDMISNSYGVQIDSNKINPEFVGKKYDDYFKAMYDKNILPIAIRHNNKHIVNPSKDIIIEDEDVVYYIVNNV